MQKTAKIISWSVAILIVIVGVYMMANKDSKEASNTKEMPASQESSSIKIGFIGPLTGDAAVYGIPGRNITQLAIDEINSNGGINGQTLEVIYEDGKCNGKDASNAARKLIDSDGVKVIIGGFCSSESLSIVPIVEEAGVFAVSPGSSSPDLTDISDYFARVYPSDAAQGEVLAQVAFHNKGWKRVAFIQEQLDYPLGIFKAFKREFVKLGGEVTNEAFPSDETDFRTRISKVKAWGPDALFVATQTPASSERVIAQVGEAGWDIPLLIADALAGDPDTLTRLGDVVEGALAAEFGVDSNNEKFKHLVSAYEERYGEELPYQSYAQTEYDAVYMLADAIREVGYDADKISEWFRTVEDWKGASGSITLGEDGDPDAGHVAKVVTGGKTEIFIPDSMK